MNLIFIPLFIGWGLLMYLFSRPYMKIRDDEDFVFKRSDRSLFLLPKIYASLVPIICWWFIGLTMLNMFFLSRLGTPLGNTDQSQAVFGYREFIITFVIPAIIMMIFLARGTRKLAKKGHLTAGYADSRINARANMFWELLGALEMGILFTVTAYWASLSAHPKGMFGFASFIFTIVFAGVFNNKIAERCMKVILGEYLKTDYEPIIARGMEQYGITKEDFYRVTLKEKYPDRGEVDGK